MGAVDLRRGPQWNPLVDKTRGERKYCGDQGKKKHERRLLVPTLNEVSGNARSESPGVT